MAIVTIGGVNLTHNGNNVTLGTINIFSGRPMVGVAKSTISFNDAGITADNMSIIYKVGDPLKSFRPDRAINAITGFEAEAGYYIVSKTDMDLKTILLPPL